VLAYGMHDLQEAGMLHGLGMSHVVFDATGILPPSSWWGSLFKGMFSISAAPSRLEIAVWLAYVIPTMVLFLRPERRLPAVASGGTAASTARPVSASH
jgi:high-affinity iron transporter